MLCIFALQRIEEDGQILRKEVLPGGDAGVNLPVNLKRLIWNAQQLFKIKKHKKVPSGESPFRAKTRRINSEAHCAGSVSSCLRVPMHPTAGLDPLEVVEKVDELCQKLVVVKVCLFEMPPAKEI